MSENLKDVKFNIQHVVERIDNEPDHILIVKSYANSGFLVDFINHFHFKKITQSTLRRIVSQISKILAKLKNEFKLRDLDLWSSNVMLHLPSSPDHLSVQENW
jgi:hypothetical protein